METTSLEQENTGRNMQKKSVVEVKENDRHHAVEVALKARRVRLYIMEERELLRETYKTSLSFEAEIEVAELSASLDSESLNRVLATIRPDVICIGTKVLQDSFVDRLEASWTKSPFCH